MNTTPQTDEAREEARVALQEALYEIKRVIVGQDAMLERLLVSLLAGGHVLLEGVPGLAKTLTVKTLAAVLGGSYGRIQFTPDLVPADLVGTRVYRPDSGGFDTELGPVFCNFLLADEINRAPAKVQSALLEVMQEQQVTIGGTTYGVPVPFIVMATQNPIESEGTYPLPEAQVDRFLMKVVVDYPSVGEEAAVVGRSLGAPAIVREPQTTGPITGKLRSTLTPTWLRIPFWSSVSLYSSPVTPASPASMPAGAFQTPRVTSVVAKMPAMMPAAENTRSRLLLSGSGMSTRGKYANVLRREVIAPSGMSVGWMRSNWPFLAAKPQRSSGSAINIARRSEQNDAAVV